MPVAEHFHFSFDPLHIVGRVARHSVLRKMFVSLFSKSDDNPSRNSLRKTKYGVTEIVLDDAFPRPSDVNALNKIWSKIIATENALNYEEKIR